MSESETVMIEHVRMNVLWTPERSAELEILWKRELSATQIAATMGNGLTRNAICGRLHRMGLGKSSHERIPRPEKKPKAPKAPRERRGDHHAVYKIANGGNGSARVIQSVASAEIAKLRSVEIDPRHLTLTALEPGDCRYPYGGDKIDGIPEKPITFCGHPSLDGKPYCMPHTTICDGPGTASERAATTAGMRH